jgi:replication initiation and membrane attachment protein DnaB
MPIDINKQNFSKLIEDYIRDNRNVEYLDAIIAVCEKYEVDPRDCKRLLSKSIVEHLEVEAMDLNMIVGGNPSYTLPI